MTRIVSLVPSLTETVCDLGITDNIVGVTQFCVYPSGLHRRAQIIGGTKDPDVVKIKALKPSHVLVNYEENKAEHIERIGEFADIIYTNIKDISDVKDTYHRIGSVLGCEQKVSEKVLALDHLIEQNSILREKSETKKVVYFIWKDPWMVASKDTYISSALDLFKFDNLIETEITRYPQVNLDRFMDPDIDYALFSSEPWPFRMRDIVDFRENTDLSIKSVKVDGKLFSWYGSTTLELLKKSIAYHLGEFKFNFID